MKSIHPGPINYVYLTTGMRGRPRRLTTTGWQEIIIHRDIWLNSQVQTILYSINYLSLYTNPSSISSFLSLGFIDIYGWIILYFGRTVLCIVRCFLYPLDANSKLPSPRCDKRMCLQTSPNISWGIKSLPCLTATDLY